MSDDQARLDAILKDIHEHHGEVTLHADALWMRKIQREMPEWAKPVFEKWGRLAPQSSDYLKHGIR